MAGHPFTVPVLLAIVIGFLSVINHSQGVDWGDDFALYMRQAKAIATGTVADTLNDNRFTVDNSGWHSFSPYSYPWGWPLILSPFYAFLGLNYEVFKYLEVLALCTFLVFFSALTRPRVGTAGSLILTLLIGLSLSFGGWTDRVLSDLPYLAFVGLTLWWMDRCRVQGLLDAVKTGSLVVLGLLIAFAFNIRREGLVLLASLAALHLTLILLRAAELKSLNLLSGVSWKMISTPYVTFLATVIAFHMLLPTVLWPRPEGSGLHNLVPRLSYFGEVLAGQLRLKDPGFDSTAALNGPAKWLLAFVAGLAVAGLIVRIAHRPSEDIALATYLGATSLIIGVSPYQEPRYLLSITPFLLYFAYQALPTLASRYGNHELPRKLAKLVSAAIFGVFLVANARGLVHSTRAHLDSEFVIHGPESPGAKEMFATVRERTLTGDVVLFFRARAMTLYTDRRAIQGLDLEPLLPRVDWYVMQKGSTYSQPLLTDAEAAGWGLMKVWENDGWVLWKVPEG